MALAAEVMEVGVVAETGMAVEGTAQEVKGMAGGVLQVQVGKGGEMMPAPRVGEGRVLALMVTVGVAA